MTITALEGPVHWDAELGAWRVTGYAEASAVLRGEGWSSDLRLSPLVHDELKDLPGGGMIVAVAPDHTRLRRPLSPAFTPRAIESLRPRVTAIVDSVLDGLAVIGPEVDVLADVGYPIALAVICELFDVGAEGAELFAELTPKLARGIEFDASAEELMAGAVASTEMTLFLTPILAGRMRRPGNDFVRALLALAGDGPGGFSLGEVLTTCVLLLVAGHETTANLIANSTLALLQEPAQIPLLLGNPGRAIEELLRCHGPVELLPRTASIEQELGGRFVHPGQAVLLDLRAANTDPVRFPGAERMDLGREPAAQLGFGAGIHFCLGAALARLETAETSTRLFGRGWNLRLAERPVRWRKSMALHALQELALQLDSGAAGG